MLQIFKIQQMLVTPIIHGHRQLPHQQIRKVLTPDLQKYRLHVMMICPTQQISLDQQIQATLIQRGNKHRLLQQTKKVSILVIQNY